MASCSWRPTAWDGSRNTARLWAARRHALDRRRRGPLARLADGTRRLRRRARRTCRRSRPELRAEGLAPSCSLLGMGGSSLCPEVLAETFGPVARRAAAARARFNRARAGRGHRARSRPTRARSSSSRASRAPRSSRTSFTPTSTIAWSRRLAAKRPAVISSPSPIRDRSSRPSPRATDSAGSSRACRRSADATRRCRRSGSCPRRRWASTCRDGTRARRRWPRCAAPDSRRARTRACLSGCCWAPAPTTVSTS